ncbi:hypothetical protein TBLA_0A05100 [Henningerozyma blattae CBS 6284]|uniref:Ribosomal RNA-processing protein 7 C-terminal domain-containing protein n=1 Tax=Henningerozyma blattae (strain ATCC 34711 / CBS 6284 / DSM 70876 / NBRC 10599 / NRRL Y-10934 / UCD 77-7) TaxID=1071380 RepID=I2GW01_HENB6|nr:hypothetical protein TBLA_0A05100 [Tetrapisispora blattae CBS 6284]CCH58303.1 hypothetical protein TBLA_0A05100 [Tetrapisispora blattae CBS 6284]
MSAKNSGVSKTESMKNGFIVVPFKLPKHKSLKEKTPSYHYMFIKKHQTKLEEESNSLFLVNIPLLANVESLGSIMKKICNQYDTVAHVEDLLYNDEFGLHVVDLSSLTSDLMSTGDISEKRFTPRNTALLKFLDESSLNNCFNALKKYSSMKDKSKLIEWEYTSPSLATFINFYKPLDVEYLKEDIHSHMTLFEQREQQAKEDIQSSIVDEDGFTLVVGKNTKSLNSIRKKILNRNPLSKHENKFKPAPINKNAKEDFYRYQIRERKKQEINELLSKFKDDQEKIKIMKAKKKFNPYT